MAWTLSWIDTNAVARMGVDIEDNAIIGCGIGGGATQIDPKKLPGGCASWPKIYADNACTLRPDLSLLIVGSWELVDHRVNGRKMSPGRDSYRTYLFGQLDLAHAVLTPRGIPLVIAITPCFDVPIRSDTDYARQQDDPTRVDWLNQVWRDYAAAHPDVKLIDMHNFLCGDGHIRDTIDGVKMRVDGMHFTPAGALVMWKWLAPQVEAIARTAPRA